MCGDVDILADDSWIVTATISISIHSFPGEICTYSSSVTRFRVLEADSMTFLPVKVLPVKEILAGPGWAVSIGPRSSPPDRTWTTPGGKNC